MDPGRKPAGPGEVQQDALAAIINREIVQLVVLAAIATAAFFFTRVIASNNRSTTRRDAASWYARGQKEIAAGNVRLAVDDFRRAMLNDRSDRRYALALSRALARNGDVTGARNVLFGLWQSSPEDPEVNVELARLAVRNDSTQSAVRYYQNALYAPWPAGAEARRRAVRLEMINLLLDHGDSARAVPELLGYAANTPDSVLDHVAMGRLFARSGEHRRSLQQFDSALIKTPRDTAALAGAVRASYALRDYPRAERYLQRLPEGVTDLKQIRDVVGWITSGDPLAGRIGLANRKKRLSDALAYEQQRLSTCVSPSATELQTQAIRQLTQRVQTLLDALRRRAAITEDGIDYGVDLLRLSAHSIDQQCGPMNARERSFILISEMHQGDDR